MVIIQVISKGLNKTGWSTDTHGIPSCPYSLGLITQLFFCPLYTIFFPTRFALFAQRNGLWDCVKNLISQKTSHLLLMLCNSTKFDSFGMISLLQQITAGLIQISLLSSSVYIFLYCSRLLSHTSNALNILFFYSESSSISPIH